MMKGAQYFTHDFHARNDPKILALQMKLGMEGVGIYWCLVEMIHEQGGYIPASDIERITFELRAQCERITSVLRDYNLFQFDGEKFWSESALCRINLRKEKSDLAKKSANARWQNPPKNENLSDCDANALRTECDGNAKKGNKRKGKEIKGKEKEKEKIDKKENFDFSDSLSDDSKKSRNGEKKSKPIPMPIDFSISERVSGWALDKGYTHLHEYLEVLRNWVENAKNRGEEKKYLDWDLVLMNCIRDDWGGVSKRISLTTRQPVYQSDTSADWSRVYHEKQ